MCQFLAIRLLRSGTAVAFEGKDIDGGNAGMAVVIHNEHWHDDAIVDITPSDD